uniref:Uncharacterized protein n=1 Tax=Timema poppense TaxID=170557 RepID=A0A7R9CUP4_TIMPO|nr:unnamed protein product [Timema poppensis]
MDVCVRARNSLDVSTNFSSSIQSLVGQQPPYTEPLASGTRPIPKHMTQMSTTVRAGHLRPHHSWVSHQQQKVGSNCSRLYGGGIGRRNKEADSLLELIMVRSFSDDPSLNSPFEVSLVSFTFPCSKTSLKAGHPHPESYLVSEEKSGSRHTKHTHNSLSNTMVLHEQRDQSQGLLHLSLANDKIKRHVLVSATDVYIPLQLELIETIRNDTMEQYCELTINAWHY